MSSNQAGPAAASTNNNSNSGAGSGQPQKEEKKEEKKIVMVSINKDEFDLENYIAAYSGHGKVARLLFIAEHCKELELDALKLAFIEVKKTLNTALYKNVCERIAGRLGNEFSFEQAWVDATDKKAAQQQERLELELNGYKTNLIKESIRTGHNELGDFYYNRGDLNSSLKCYVRTRDYCTTSQHIIQMCMNVIRVSVEMGNYAHVVNYVAKAEQTPDLKDKIILAKLRVVSGLANLENRKYKPAAKKFLETTGDLGDNYNEVLSAQDVAYYGGLTALATYDRSELKKKVIDDALFRPFLELAPDVREIINDFYESKYASCFKGLEKIKSTLMLDIHLHEHVELLYQKIRNKALVQYFSPYLSIDLNQMAAAFNTNLPGLEKELSRLIMEGAIQARIDSHNKRLYARQTDQRTTTFEKTLQVGEEYQANMKSMLLRMNMLRNDFIVKPPRPMMQEKKP